MNVSARPKITTWDYVTGSARLVRMTNLVIVALTQYLTRILLIGPRQEWKSIITDIDMFVLALSTVCIAAAGYIINDYFDVKIDIVNKPERVVVGRYLKRRWAMGAHQVLNVLGAILGLVVSPYIFVINVFSITLLWFYSERYKRLPFIGNFIVSLLTGLTLLILTVHYPANRHLDLRGILFFHFADTRGSEGYGGYPGRRGAWLPHAADHLGYPPHENVPVFGNRGFCFYIVCDGTRITEQPAHPPFPAPPDPDRIARAAPLPGRHPSRFQGNQQPLQDHHAARIDHHDLGLTYDLI